MLYRQGNDSASGAEIEKGLLAKPFDDLIEAKVSEPPTTRPSSLTDHLTQRLDRELDQPYQHALLFEIHELGAHREPHAVRLVDEFLLQTHQLGVKAQAGRNRAIAHLLLNFGMVHGKVEVALDLYFKQCSILVNCRDLAVMGATLPNLDKNLLTGGEVYDIDRVKNMLSI